MLPTFWGRSLINVFSLCVFCKGEKDRQWKGKREREGEKMQIKYDAM